MAWSTPRTWSAGETVTATLMNLHLRDQLNILKTKIADSGALVLDVENLVMGKANTTQVFNSGTAETDLMTYSLPAGTLAADGDTVYFDAVFLIAAEATHTKTAKMKFGSSGSVTVYNSTAGTSFILVRMWVTRTGAATQRILGTYTVLGGSTTPFAASGTETCANAITVKGTGQSSAASNEVSMTDLVRHSGH